MFPVKIPTEIYFRNINGGIKYTHDGFVKEFFKDMIAADNIG